MGVMDIGGMAPVAPTVSDLPPDVLDGVFSNLPFWDLASACAVNKSWGEVAGASSLWQRLCRLRWVETSTRWRDLERAGKWKTIFGLRAQV